MPELKENHIDELLIVVLTILIFLVGLAWNTVVDTFMRLYASSDSMEPAIIYAVLITVLAFAFGDYVVNKLGVQPYDTDCYMHRAIKWVGKEKQTLGEEG